MSAAGERLTPQEIATLFLFESLEPDQLGWLAEHGRVETRPAGADVYAEGEQASCFFVLLEGTVAMSRRVQGDEVPITRTSQRGVYAGATQAYVSTQDPLPYANTLRAVTDTRFFVLPADTFAQAMRSWFPMAMHLLEGLFFGFRAGEAIVGQRQRLLALGQLTAGLTHELNNPAAAAVRAAGTLRERVAAMRRKLAALAGGHLDADALTRLVDVQEDAVARLERAPRLSPLETSDREDELSGWLDDHGLRAGWELAPVLVAAGLDTDWLDGVAAATPAEHLEGALRWVTYTLETEQLMREIQDAAGRISTLVGAAKQYSQLDRAEHQDVDVHEGLDSTLVMLGPKLAPLEVVKDYDRSLPPVPAYPAELNQVWTNLIDNAVGAMAGSGTLTVRTAREGDQVLVEVGDTGPGVPTDIQRRIFEPFFTTKPVGEGTGLGLDISYRIVVQRHGGDLRVVSAPGDTRFQVWLPVNGSIAAT